MSISVGVVLEGVSRLGEGGGGCGNGASMREGMGVDRERAGMPRECVNGRERADDGGLCGNRERAGEGGGRAYPWSPCPPQGDVDGVSAKGVLGLDQDLAWDGPVPCSEVFQEAREPRSVIVDDVAEDGVAFAPRDGLDDDGELGADERDGSGGRGGGGSGVVVRHRGVLAGELDVLGVHCRCWFERGSLSRYSAVMLGLR